LFGEHVGENGNVSLALDDGTEMLRGKHVFVAVDMHRETMLNQPNPDPAGVWARDYFPDGSERSDRRISKPGIGRMLLDADDLLADMELDAHIEAASISSFIRLCRSRRTAGMSALAMKTESMRPLVPVIDHSFDGLS
jgi:hypothetical protein